MTAPRPVPGDVVIAVAAMVIRRGVRITGMVTPVLGPLLRTEHWPWPARQLARIGCAQRQQAIAQLTEWYHAAASAVTKEALDQLDLPEVVRQVLEDSDLPELIRLSAGSVATDAVRGVRVRTMTADETVSRWIARIVSGPVAADVRAVAMEPRIDR